MSESDTMFNELDRRCAAVQLQLSTDPSYDNRTIASTLKCNSGLPRIKGTCPEWWKQSFRLRLWSSVWFQVRATSCHLTSSKSAWKVYLDVLKSVVILWCNQVAGGRPWVWQQDSAPAHKSKETQAWLQMEYYDFVPFSHCVIFWPSTRPKNTIPR